MRIIEDLAGVDVEALFNQLDEIFSEAAEDECSSPTVESWRMKTLRVAEFAAQYRTMQR